METGIMIALTKIFSEFGLSAGIVIVFIISLFYYTPKLFAKYFEQQEKIQEQHRTFIKELQNDYKIALEKSQADNKVNLLEILNTNKEIHFSFIEQLKNIEKDHLEQNQKLNLIHDDIKEIKIVVKKRGRPKKIRDAEEYDDEY